MKKIKNTWSSVASGGVLLGVAVALGIVTAALTLGWLNSQDGASDEVSASTAAVPERAIVVARGTIPSGTKLDTALMRIVVVDESTVAAGAVESLDEAVGRTTRYPLAAGEQILASKLVDGASGDGLAFSIPDGKRAVSVAFSEVMGAGGLVVPGDRVDVLVSTQYERLFGPGESLPLGVDSNYPTVITALQNMLVLAIGQEFTASAEETGGSGDARAQDVAAQPGAGSITLAVTQDEAQLLFLATQEGTLGLALRKFGDGSEGLVAPAFKLTPATGAADSLAAALR
jgi:pilus assembly protein CpaB